MRLRAALTSASAFCAIVGSAYSGTLPLNMPIPISKTAAKIKGEIFAQPSPQNYQTGKLIAGKPVIAPKNNNFVEIGKKISKNTSSGPFSKVQEAPPGIMLGITYYDLQSNGSMPHRISMYEEGNDKTAQVIWMGATDMERFNPPHPTRGSYYAQIDVKDPLNPVKYNDVPWERIEGTVRSGFPSIIQFKDGSVGSIAHVISSSSSASAMRFTRNTSFGDVAFTSSQIPGADSSLWGHATTDGDDVIHLAFTSDTSSKNFGGQVVYMRSTDKGTTWSSPKILTGPLSDPQLPTGRGANSYQLATRGSTVALAYEDSTYTLRILKSTDNGETWGQALNVFGGSRHENAYIVEDYGDGTFRATTDTIPICGPSFDIAIDVNDNIHGMASTTPSWIIGTAKKNDQDQIEFIDDTTYASLYTRALGVYFDGSKNQYGLTTMAEDWDGQGTVVTRPFGSGLCRHFKLGVEDADNSLYMVYTGIKNGDVLETILADGNSDFGLQGHIYVAKKFDGADLWETEIDLTPAEYDSQFPSMYHTVKDGIVMLAYQADRTPGVSIQNTNQDVEENGVYYYAFRPTFVSVNEKAIEETAFTIAPNPAQDMVTLSFGATADGANIIVTNALGMKVAEMPSEFAQQGRVVLSTSSFPAGTYFCTLQSGGKTVTRMLNIVR